MGVSGHYGYNMAGADIWRSNPTNAPYPSNVGLGQDVVLNVPASISRQITPNMVKQPAAMIAFGDSWDIGQKYIDDLVLQWITPDKYSPQPQWPATLHFSGANMVFCDAHIE